MNRRTFLVTTGGGLLGLSLGGCHTPSRVRCKTNAAYAFPKLEVSGSSYEIGLAVGKRFEEFIRKGLARRKVWFERIKAFMEADLASRYEPFASRVKERLPEVFEELRGWADGSGVPLKDLMALNLKAELLTMMRAKDKQTPGCSTLCYSDTDRFLISHNEDGNQAYSDLMFVLTASRPGKPTFKSLVYPGILPGNATTINEAGLVMTTNAIDGDLVKPGLGKYFLCRAAIDATSLEEARKIVTQDGRAYTHHFNLGSCEQKKILSIEISPGRYQVRQVKGLYVHTNHLILPEMKDIPQNQKYIEQSSMPRYRTLTGDIEKLAGNYDHIDADTLLNMLSNHQGAPFSPCRHPQGPTEGQTLANSTFDLARCTWRITYGNTCKGKSELIRVDS